MKNKIWEKQNVESFTKNENSNLQTIESEMLKMLGNIKNKELIDYGCGDGKFLRELHDLGANVKGYDISEPMIEIARKHLSKNIEVKAIKSGEIPLKNSSIDLVISKLVLMMCSSLEEIFKIFIEISRVLRNKGTFIFCITHPAFIDKDFSTHRNILSKERNYSNEGESYNFVLKNNEGTEIKDESFVDYFYKLSSYLNLLSSTGFNFKEIKEIQCDNDKFPSFLIMKGEKA